MADIVFYEKPGCGTNARQKQMLEAAGYSVCARNLLKEAWTADRLQSFFGSAPVASWFNPAAPAVKSGMIDPGTLTAAAALDLMASDPLLIRRPLLEFDGKRCAGFEGDLVASLLGSHEQSRDSLGCRKIGAFAPCPVPDGAERQTGR